MTVLFKRKFVDRDHSLNICIYRAAGRIYKRSMEIRVGSHTYDTDKVIILFVGAFCSAFRQKFKVVMTVKLTFHLVKKSEHV